MNDQTTTAPPGCAPTTGSETVESRLTKLLGHRPRTAGEIIAELDREGWTNVDMSFMDDEAAESPNVKLTNPAAE